MSISPGLKKKIYILAKKKRPRTFESDILKFCLLSCAEEFWAGTGHKLLGKRNLFQRRYCIGVDDVAHYKPPGESCVTYQKEGY